MKSICLWQPWATLLVTGHKKIETRKWRPLKYMGTFAIVAAKNFPDEAKELSFEEPFASALREIYPGLTIRQIIEKLPTGKIVGTVETTHYLPTTSISESAVGAKEIALGDFSNGRWGWYLQNPRVLTEPIPCKGKLTYWDLPEEIEKQILEQTK